MASLKFTRKPRTIVPGLNQQTEDPEENKNITNPDDIMPPQMQPIQISEKDIDKDKESFGSTCSMHSKPRRLYCYKKSKFICEDCTDDESDIIQVGHLAQWVQEKCKIDRLVGEQQAQSQSGKQEILNKLRSAVDEEYAKSCKYLEELLKKNDLMPNTDDKLLPEQRDDIYNLMKVKTIADKVGEIDKTLEKNLTEQLSNQNMYDENTFKNVIDEMLQ